MKKKKISDLHTLIILLALASPTTALADAPPFPKIIISEVQIEGAGTNDDFVELYNPAGSDIALKDYKLVRRTKTGTTNTSLRSSFGSGDIVPAGGYFLLVNQNADKTLLSLKDGDFVSGTSLTPDNSIAILDKNNTIIDSLTWGGGQTAPFSSSSTDNPKKNESLVRNLATLSIDISPHPTPTNRAGKTVSEPDPVPAPPLPTTLRFNEVFPDPDKSPESDFEFVELFNFGDTAVDVQQWHLKDSSKNAPLDGKIPAHGYRAFYHTVTLNNDGDTITLTDPQGTTIDTLAYSRAKTGFSYGRKIDGAWEWSSQPSADVENTFPLPDPTPPPTPDPVVLSTQTTPTEITVRLNEVFPDPSAKGDTGEFIELYNIGATAVDLSGWIIRDATKTGKFTIPAGSIIAPAGYIVFTDQQFTLSLNNTNETLSLFDDHELLIDSMSYAKSKADVSLNSISGNWRGGKPTPGIPNIVDNLPTTQERVPKQGYRGVPLAFDAHGSDTDGDHLKYVWDFGDGHKSYLEKTTHTYEKKGKYTVTLTTTDGRDETIETFTVRIDPFPHPKIRITDLVPNPTGSDSDHEWILVENRGKKDVNLNGWSIATGWKTVSNHPIRIDIILEPHRSFRLTRAVSLFTLPNQKGRVELRSPDGRTLQKIKYKLAETAVENTTLHKTKGSPWVWQENKVEEKTTVPDKKPETETATTPTVPIEPETPVIHPTETVSPTADLPSPPTPPTTDDTLAPENVIPGQPATSPAPTETESQPVSTPQDTKPIPTKSPVTLLNIGTHLHLPQTIAYTPTDLRPQSDRRAIPDHYAVAFAKKALTEMNASLNTALDRIAAH